MTTVFGRQERNLYSALLIPDDFERLKGLNR